jgi:DNA polymerase-1
VPKLDAFLSFDYKAIEYRMLAYYLAAQLGDFEMAENFKAGKDPHAETARLILEIDERPLTDVERQTGKVLNFSIIFLGGTPTIMRQLGCDYKRAKYLLGRLHEEMPGIEQLLELIRERIQERGYVESIAGRHLHPKPGERQPERLLLNGLIQGGAAEIMRRGLRITHEALKKEGFKAHGVNVVHDELLLDCPFDELEDLVGMVPGWLRDRVVDPIVPVEVDIEVSTTTWAGKEKYE